MHVDAYDKAAAKAAQRTVRSLTAVVVLLIAVASVTALLLPGGGMGPFGGPMVSAFFLLAGLTTWLLFRLRSIVRRSAITAERLVDANHRIRESEERYRMIVTATPELVLIGRNGLVDYINGSGAAMLGAR